MSELITIRPGFRGLTPRGEKAFKIAIESSYIFEGDRPILRFSRDASEIIREVSELRKRDWKTTSRWNPEADYIGLLGEIAVQRYLGFTAEKIISEFLAGLKGTDGGYDVVVEGLKLDVKSSKSESLRLKISKTNRFTHLADGYIFAHVELAGLETRIEMFGWSFRADVKPHLRDEGHRYTVRVHTLHREGILRPLSELKNQKEDSNHA